MLFKTLFILNIFIDYLTYFLKFLQQFAWQSGFGILLLYNIYLTIAWIKREKNFQLVEIAFESFIPKIKFELNKDEKLKRIIEENIALKAENVLLKQQNKNLPFIITGILFIALILSNRGKTTKEKDDKKNKKISEIENKKLPFNEKDPFDITDFKEKIEDINFNFDINKKDE